MCAYGRVGQTQPHIFLRRISQSEIRNSAAAEKSESESEGGPRRRNFVSLRGKQKFLLFACPVASRGLCYGARPSVQFLPREARQSVRILFKKGSREVYNYSTRSNFVGIDCSARANARAPQGKIRFCFRRKIPEFAPID